MLMPGSFLLFPPLFFQNIQFHLPAAYFLIQSGDFLPQRIAFCLREGALCLRIVW